MTDALLLLSHIGIAFIAFVLGCSFMAEFTQRQNAKAQELRTAIREAVRHHEEGK